MRPAVRLTRRPGGGFLLDDGETAIEAVPDGDGFRLVEAGGPGGRLRPEGSGELSLVLEDGSELGRLGAGEPSILLADGRLLRVAVVGLTTPRVEVSRWDVPGPYVVAHPESGGWRITRTPAGEASDGAATVEILAAAAIRRLEEW